MIQAGDEWHHLPFCASNEESRCPACRSSDLTNAAAERKAEALGAGASNEESRCPACRDSDLTNAAAERKVEALGAGAYERPFKSADAQV